MRHRVEIHGLRTWIRDYLGVDLLSGVRAGPAARASTAADAVGASRPPADAIRASLSSADWLALPQQKLRSIVAGEVFRDGLTRIPGEPANAGQSGRDRAVGEGALGAVRNALAWYPDDTWRYLLAAVWARLGQEEHLVGRAGQVGDELGARLVAARLVRDVMRLCFLAEREYAPYSKWFGTAFAELASARTMKPLLESVLAAGDWRARDRALAAVYEALAGIHNSLAITAPLPERVTRFFGRPFHVMAIRGFSGAILETIHEPWLTALLREAPLGNVDLITDNTELLEQTAFAPALRHLLAGEL